MHRISRNSDKSLLVTAREPDFDLDAFSRRKFLRLGAMTTTVMTILPIALFTQEAKAGSILFPWIAWTGRQAFAAGISWLVNRVLDKIFLEDDPKIADRLDVRSITPRPTGDSFHDSHADPYAVMNSHYHFDAEYSSEFEYYVELSAYLRFDKANPIADSKDLSTLEIKRLAKEVKYYRTILFPCGLRERPSKDHRDGYHSTCTEYNVHPDLLELEYVRPFNDGRDLYSAYGVKIIKTGEKDLLISV